MDRGRQQSLAGRVALVTGASRGIGAAIARRFAAEGAAVALVARTLDEVGSNSETLRATADAIARAGGRAQPIRADLARAADRERAVERAVEALGPIDVLVNNAARADGETLAELRETYEVNAIAPLDLARRVLPSMREHGEGWILNIGSAAAQRPEPPYSEFHRTASEAWLHYAATKAALDRLTSGLAALHCDANIAVNGLTPRGVVVTSRLIEEWGSERIAQLESQSHAVETVEAMAEAALALCSVSARDVTGRNAVCSTLLEELGREVRGLDGQPLHDAGATSAPART